MASRVRWFIEVQFVESRIEAFLSHSGMTAESASPR
jgi:hypothetical protein